MPVDDHRGGSTDTTWDFQAPPPAGEVGPGPDSGGELAQPGARIDHYDVVRLVGRGGMGEVYLARDTRLGRKVALKVIRPDAVAVLHARDRFLREARLTAQFAHPHIVTIYAVGEAGGCPYLALEFLEGQSLGERLAEGRLGTREVLRYGLAVAEALEEAHAHGVLHRDLKPDNVFLPRDGRLRVVDFGLARPIQSAARPSDGQAATETALGDLYESGVGQLAGTPRYMAPEQWLRRDVTAAADVWALGLILYEALAGRGPLGSTTIEELMVEVCSAEPLRRLERPDLPAAIGDLVAACLDKDPAARPSAGQVREALAEHLSGRQSRLSSEACPFRGLLPFTENQADLFMGRDSEVDAFVERLRQQPVAPVVGPSGAGKSSFVEAGVIPRLREQGRWTVLRVRPGATPFEALASRLRRGEAESSATGQRAEAPWALPADSLRDTPSLLAFALQQLAAQAECRVLLFVDQLEELYTLVDDPELRRAYMDAICAAADDPWGPVRVVMTLRDDFLVRLSETAAAQRAFGRSTVLRSPDSAQLRSFLEQTVARVGHRYEDESLVDEMLSAVEGEMACLPLLQFAGVQLWNQRDEAERVLTRAAYRDFGGVEGALAHHAEGVLGGLTPDQVGLVRALALRLVTTEGTRRVLARHALLDGLPDAATTVLSRLADERVVLVRKARGAQEGQAEVELVHESLIGNWSRLATWIAESRDDLVFLHEVELAAGLWARRGHRDAEVWRGEALWEAQRKVERLETVPSAVQAFLEAGLQRQRRHTGRRRVMVAGALTALALVAVGMTVLWLDAREQGRRASEEAAVAQQMVDFLEGLFEIATPEQARGRTITAQDIVDEGVRRVESGDIDDPEASARLQSKLGSVLGQLSGPHPALPLLEASTADLEALLGPDHPVVLRSRCDLAKMIEHAGRTEEGLALAREVHADQRRVVGPAHPDTLETSKVVLSALVHQGDFEEVDAFASLVRADIREVLGPDDPAALEFEGHRASQLVVSGRHHEAQAAFQEVIPRMQATLGEDHPETLKALALLGYLHNAQERSAEAEVLHVDLIERCERVFGPDHFQTILVRRNYARTLKDVGRLEEAEAQAELAVESARTTLGEDNAFTLGFLNTLVSIYKQQGKFEQAEHHSRIVAAGTERLLGPDHFYTHLAHSELAEVLRAQGRLVEAEEVLSGAVEGLARATGEDGTETLRARCNLGTLSVVMGGTTRAEQLLGAVRTSWERTGSQDAIGLACFAEAARAYVGVGEHEAALDWLELAVTHGGIDAAEIPDDPKLAALAGHPRLLRLLEGAGGSD